MRKLSIGCFLGLLATPIMGHASPSRGDTVQILSTIFACTDESVEKNVLRDFVAASAANNEGEEEQIAEAAKEVGCRPFTPGDGEFLVTDSDEKQSFVKIFAGYDEASKSQLYFWMPAAFTKVANESTP